LDLLANLKIANPKENTKAKGKPVIIKLYFPRFTSAISYTDINLIKYVESTVGRE
jgi:hypothetical protein